MSILTNWLDARLYPSQTQNWDDKLFRATVLRHARRGHDVLDLGAGAGIIEAMDFRGLVGRVRGLDPDPRVLSNPHLDEAILGTGERVPYPDEQFDLVIADNVVEHLTDPVAVFAEIARVLKRGGRFLFKTPNRNHYMATVARLTPLSFHRCYNKARGRSTTQTFPTKYLANTRSAIRRVAKKAGLIVESVEMIEGRPEYLRPLALTYILGWVYERCVNTLPFLEGFRVVIVATLRRP